MKMLKREQEQRQAIEMLCVDMLVPKAHLLRKIDAAVDFTHIYDLVEDLYCEDNGRPSCDPVVLFKLVFSTAGYNDPLSHDVFLRSGGGTTFAVSFMRQSLYRIAIFR